MGSTTAGPQIRFDAAALVLGSRTVVRLPLEASRRLPSRGQVAVRGTLDGHAFSTVVEPDGSRGHWIGVDPALQERAGVRAGDRVVVVIEPVEDWPEPAVPDDLDAALHRAPEAVQELWRQITPMARWEWVRWVNATRNPATRQRRVEVSISKLDGGKRRPCCFDLSSCTDPELSRSGRLVEPS